MEVNGGSWLVSVVVQSCVEEVHRHMMGSIISIILVCPPGMALDYSNLVGVGCHGRVHHNYCLDMHY